MMKRLWAVFVVALVAACGCTRQEKAQQQLITQLEAGLADIGSYCESRQQMIDDSYQQRRQVLDDAFDDDVRRIEQMDVPWVIEHRKAYAAGMEAIWKAQVASQESHRRAMANLAAASDGLERLRWISEMRETWGKTFEQLKQEVSDESR